MFQSLFQSPKKATIIGATSLFLGLGEASQATASPDLASMLGPVNIMAGGTLLVAVWVGRGFVRLGEQFFDEQGSKLMSLPTAQELSADKRLLFEKLEEFAKEGRTVAAEVQRISAIIEVRILTNDEWKRATEQRMSALENRNR